MATAGGSGNTYRLGMYVDVCTIGANCTGSTTVAISAAFTDPNASAVTTFYPITASGVFTILTNGTLGTNTLSTGASAETFNLFPSKASTTVTYSTTYTIGSGCTIGPSYRVYPILEQLQ